MRARTFLLLMMMGAGLNGLQGDPSHSSLFATEPRESGAGELVIHSAPLDDQGRPLVKVSADNQVEIPPTLHIHRYYYAGDKEYQGPLIVGGPTIIVASHPATGCRMCIEAKLPAGAPLIVYDRTSITYVYEDRRVIIRFRCNDHHQADVLQLPGKGVMRKVEEHGQELKTSARKTASHSKIIQSAREHLSQRKEVAKGAIGVLDGGGGAVLDKVGQFTSMLPLVKPLESLGKQSAERGAQEELRQAAARQKKEATEFIRTVR